MQMDVFRKALASVLEADLTPSPSARHTEALRTVKKCWIRRELKSSSSSVSSWFPPYLSALPTVKELSPFTCTRGSTDSVLFAEIGPASRDLGLLLLLSGPDVRRPTFVASG